MHVTRWRRRLTVLIAVLLGLLLVPASPALAYYPTTAVAPGASSSANRTFTAVTDNRAGQILYNWWDLGGSGVWWVMPSGCATNAAPAVSLVNNGSYVFILAKGIGGGLCLNQSSLNGSWVGWHSMGFTTNLAPAAASWGNRSAAVVVATDGTLYYTWWDLGGGAQPFRPVPGGLHTDAAAAVALVDSGNYLFVLAKGPGGGLYLNQGSPGGAWVGWQYMGFTTNVAPAASSSGNRTSAVVTATDGTIYYTWWDLGGGAQPFRQVPGGFHTDAAPAAALVNHGNYLFILAKTPGTSANIYLNQGAPGGAFVGWQFL
jgi:hypothetical protein